jgi:hypothetical protein
MNYVYKLFESIMFLIKRLSSLVSDFNLYLTSVLTFLKCVFRINVCTYVSMLWEVFMD